MQKHTAMGPVTDIPLESLRAFHTNPFGLYSGQRFEDMVESIQANGVLVPIIVRPRAGGDGGSEAEGVEGSGSDELSGNFGAESVLFEILSGHNRVEASRAIGLATVPAVIRDDLTDEEALLISVETNLMQRSISDLTHSERALVLSVHHEAIKHQGRRTDLIAEVEELLREDANSESGENYTGSDSEAATSGAMHPKLRARDRAGVALGLSGSVVAYYIRIDKLIPSHKARLDKGHISMRAAVSLSYLAEKEQELVSEVLSCSGGKLSMAEAESLRHGKRPLTLDGIERIIKEGDKDNDAPQKLTLSQEFLARYFTPEQSRSDMLAVIAEALETHFGARQPIVS